MLGRTLAEKLSGHELLLTDIEEMDITASDSVMTTVKKFDPDYVIHCAAMTDVDGCESAPEKAFMINGTGTGNIASSCAGAGAHLIYVSTDYVFDGTLQRPYHEDDATNPTTVYGASKLAGEEAVRSTCPEHSIVRIAWLYGPGGPSFFHTMQKLMSQEGDPLRVVNDQHGNPTSTAVVAQVIDECIVNDLKGVVHATCEGETTWFEFARGIAEELGSKREILPCSTEEFPRPARRPQNSRLEKRTRRDAGLPDLPHWREALSQFISST